MEIDRNHVGTTHMPKVMADVLELVAVTMECDNPSHAIIRTSRDRFYALHSCHRLAMIDLLGTLFQTQRVSAEGVRHMRKEMLTSFGIE